jgi:hypothetical protein
VSLLNEVAGVFRVSRFRAIRWVDLVHTGRASMPGGVATVAALRSLERDDCDLAIAST